MPQKNILTNKRAHFSEKKISDYIVFYQQMGQKRTCHINKAQNQILWALEAVDADIFRRCNGCTAACHFTDIMAAPK